MDQLDKLAWRKWIESHNSMGQSNSISTFEKLRQHESNKEWKYTTAAGIGTFGNIFRSRNTG
jgi:hypothetical protein